MKSTIVLCIVAVLIGLTQAILLTYCWAYIAAYDPLPMWLARHVTGSLFYVLVGFLGFAMNVLLCLPAAYAICKLRPRKLGIYVPLAVVPIFLWEYWPVVGPVLGEHWSAYTSRALSVLLMLPIAVLFLRRITASA